MLALSFLGLIVLWFLEYFRLEGLTLPYFTVYNLSGNPVSLWAILILAVTLFAIIFAPTPNRLIAGFLLFFWILTVLGIISISLIPLASVLILGIIVVIALGLIKPSEV